MSTVPTAVPKPDRRSARRERRAHVRHPGADLSWLRASRLKHGPSVSLLDLSAGGALLETQAALRPGTTLSLELSPADGQPTFVTMRVLRSQVTSLRPDALVYRGAGVFAHPLTLQALAPPPPIPASPAFRPFVGLDSSLKLLVQRYRESRAPGSLQTTQVLQVLRTLRSRAEGLTDDPLAGALVDLFPTIALALERRDDPVPVLAAIESRLRSAIPHAEISLTEVAAQPRGPEGAALVFRPDHVTDLAFALNVRLEPGSALHPADHQLLNAAVHLCSLLDAAGLRRTDDDASATARWQKIVVRYKDGRLFKGFTHDFHPTRAHFAIWPSINAPQHEGIQVPLAGLKAVFFVRDFRGDAEYVEDKHFEQAGHGRRIEVTFFDQEVLVGTTLSYRPDGQGFFLIPADPRTNNVRVFVVTSAVRHVRFLGQTADAAPPVLQLAG
jgi:hypothetical protein